MKNTKKLVMVICTIVILFINSFTSFAGFYDEPAPYAYATGSVSETKTKSLNSNEGNLKISYTISGLYVYDVNSGAITSAYGTKLKETSLISAPHDGDWELSIEDLVMGTPTISANGASATYPVRFHVYARYLPGGVGLWERIDFGIVNDYIMAYAQ